MLAKDFQSDKLMKTYLELDEVLRESGSSFRCRQRLTNGSTFGISLRYLSSRQGSSARLST